ncbi:MAG: DUF2855 family protein [Actinomycetota bacterium]
MHIQRLVVPRADLSNPMVVDESPPDLAPGQVLAAITLFGLSANNITYALFGDALGYWAYFPVDDDHGCIPVWGFADVVDSRSEHVLAGDRIFGYLPMADAVVLTPAAPTELGCSDASPSRADLHPWYNRYYRCTTDPLWTEEGEQLQVSMWALFMTGWALADQLAGSASTVVVSSASSKTAMALAWSLNNHDKPVTVVGVTSAGNASFVEASGVYDRVTTYDDLQLVDASGPVAFVDAAGSPGIKEAVHAALGDRLVDSVILGATHQGGAAATGELVGPEPRFFFIPDVAEAAVDDVGLPAYHGAFADAWHRFAPWIGDRLQVEKRSGADEIVDAYGTVLAGGLGPDVATVLTW